MVFIDFISVDAETVGVVAEARKRLIPPGRLFGKLRGRINADKLYLVRVIVERI